MIILLVLLFDLPMGGRGGAAVVFMTEGDSTIFQKVYLEE